MANDTKTAQVKRHLLKYRKITSWDAIEHYRATRLASIIFNLKDQGWPIKSHRVDFVDINGNKSHYALYTLPYGWSDKDLEPKKAGN